jgi:hypothetical protein
MDSSELAAAISHLSGQIQLLSELAASPGKMRDSGRDISALRREVARGAREVEAWGSELFDSRAVAASHQAYKALAQSAAAFATQQRPIWSKAGALVCLQVRYDRDVDPNRLVQRLQQATLENIISNPPCFPLEVCVGLLAIDDEALLRWTAGLSEPADAITTMAPFLVGLTFRAKGFTGAYALIDHVDSVTTVAHYSHCLPCDTGVERAVIPLSGSVVSLIERRCVGSPVCGRYLAR